MPRFGGTPLTELDQTRPGLKNSGQMFWWDKNMSHQLNDLCKVNDMKIQIILGHYMYVKFRNKIRLIQCIQQQLTMAFVYRPRPVCTTGTNSRPTLLMLCMFCWVNRPYALQWRHNGRGGVSNHQPHDCLLNRLFKRRSKKTSKPRFTGLCARNSPVTGEFPAQMASHAENVSMWWRHRGPLGQLLGGVMWLISATQKMCH